jgi:DNA transformation protein
VSRLEELPNLGAVMVQKLKEAGIETPEQLGAMGAKQAWRQIRALTDSDICLSALQALEGAVRGVRWHDLPPDIKQDLKAFYQAEKGK